MLLCVSGKKNTTIKEDIENALNLEYISEELRNNSFNLNNRLTLVIDIMSKICSKARDTEIEELRTNQTTSVEFLKKLFTVLENMKSDMRNFLLSYYRKSIITNCIKYEAKVFYSCLESTPVPLIKTVAWLSSSIESLKKQEVIPQHLTNLEESLFNRILEEAYVILLREEEKDYPETIALDSFRLKSLNNLLNSSILVSVILNVLKKKLRILKPLHSTIETDITNLLLADSNEELFNHKLGSSELAKIGEEIITLMEETASKYSVDLLDETFKNFFITKITQLENKSDPVWILFEKRVFESIFTDNISKANPSSLHFSLESVTDSILRIREIYFRFIYFNKSVYSDYYFETVKQLLLPN